MWGCQHSKYSCALCSGCLSICSFKSCKRSALGWINHKPWFMAELCLGACFYFINSLKFSQCEGPRNSQAMKILTLGCIRLAWIDLFCPVGTEILYHDHLLCLCIIWHHGCILVQSHHPVLWLETLKSREENQSSFMAMSGWIGFRHFVHLTSTCSLWLEPRSLSVSSRQDPSLWTSQIW